MSNHHELQAIGKTMVNNMLLVSSDHRRTACWSGLIREHFVSNFQIHEVSTGRNAAGLLHSQKFEVAIVDSQLEDMNSVALIDALLEISPSLAIIMVVREGSELMAAEALKHGAVDYYVDNPKSPESLKNVLEIVLQNVCSIQQKNRAQVDLEQAQQEINHLVSALSHDMNANMMMLDYSFQKLKKSVKKPSLAKVLNDVQHIEACLQGSKQFLEDLTMLSKTGSVEMQPQMVQLGAVVHEVIFQQQELIDERQVKVHIEENMPEIFIHPRRLNQVLTNLIRNAVKHGCDATEPCLNISTLPGRSHQAEKDFVWLRIYDNGCGIANADHERIFSAGVRLPQAHQHGSGIGLAIVKRIVDQNGGEIYLDPHCKKGTAFILSLPRHEILATKPQDQSRSIRTDSQQELSTAGLAALAQPSPATQSLPTLPSSTFMPQR